MKPLSRSREDYLKALYALAPGGELVVTSRLAGRLFQDRLELPVRGGDRQIAFRVHL